jgi:hypothetical protein
MFAGVNTFIHQGPIAKIIPFRLLRAAETRSDFGRVQPSFGYKKGKGEAERPRASRKINTEEIMKLTVIKIAAAVVLIGTGSLIAQDEKDDTSKGNIGREDVTVYKATVMKVDREKREVELKARDGTVNLVKVPDTVRNFKQIKIGDIVTAKYTRSIALDVRKSDESPTATARDSIERAPIGSKPGAQRTSTVEIKASIEKINKEKRELTLMGPGGNERTIDVPEEIKKFDDLKVGDQVVITATESVAISVGTPEQ